MDRLQMFSELEAAVLLDYYLKVYDGKMIRREAIQQCSNMLRKIAVNNGISIDERYRNIAGITFQMESMESAYHGRTIGKPSTKLFDKIVGMYWTEKTKYNELLEKAYRISTGDNFGEEYFWDWMSHKVSEKRIILLKRALQEVERYSLKLRWIKKNIFERIDEEKYKEIKSKISKDNYFCIKHREILVECFAVLFYLITYAEYISKIKPQNEEEKREELPIDLKIETKKYDSNEFLTWLIKVKKYSDRKARMVVACIREIERYAKEHNFINCAIFSVKLAEAQKTAEEYFDYVKNSGEFLVPDRHFENCFNDFCEFYNYDTGYPQNTEFTVVDTEKSISNKNELNDNGKTWDEPDLREDIKVDNIEETEYKEEEILKEKNDIYKRLEFVAKLYDDPAGLEVGHISNIIGTDNLDIVCEILDNVSWATKIGEKRYLFSSRQESSQKEPIIDKESYVRVLMSRYPNGMQFDSIDIENYRDTYYDIEGKKIECSDEQLVNILRQCGVVYKDRVFPSEGIIDKNTKEKLFKYIDNVFSNGNRFLYYKAIFNDLSEDFAYCYNLADENILKLYLEFVCGSGSYYFYDEYMTKEKLAKADYAAEVEKYLLSVGKPLFYKEIYEGLSHISQSAINNAIRTSSLIICNAKEQYFHYGIFEFSLEDADEITKHISNAIEEDGYCIWSRLFVIIQKKMPTFIENNIYLSSLGIRNAVARKLYGRFNFDSEVISPRGTNYSMADVFRLYGEHHAPFSDDDIYCFSREINCKGIYFDSLSENTIRVSKHLFVPKKDIIFDVEAIDNAISTYLPTGYMLIREIDSFLVFPNVGYEWNEFLLESYLMYYSRKYALLNNGRSLGNVAGAVTRKGSGFDDFMDICADVLARSGCNLTKNKALDYLGEVNLITRRSYSRIDEAITRAKQIRNRKDS